MHRAAPRLAPLVALVLWGCPAEDDDAASGPRLGGTPAAAVKACHDYVHHAAEMIHRVCPEGENSSPAELEDAIEAHMAEPCDEADGLLDGKAFAADCLPGLDAMTECPGAEGGTLPEACKDQIQFKY